MHPMIRSKLTHTALIAAVLAAAAGAQAADKPAGKEKCYGVSEVGKNDCAAANGSHTCGGKAKVAFDGQEWKEVPRGTCETMHGSLKPFDGVNAKLKDQPTKG
jgi:uncharacterized membrane protein